MFATRRGFLQIFLIAVAVVGCSVPPPPSIGLTPGKFRAATKATLAKLGYGLGWIPGKGAPLVNDTQIRIPAFRVADTPTKKKVDLRPFASPVRNQASFGSCTAFAIVSGLKEFQQLKSVRDRGGDATGSFVPLSPGYLWFNERALMQRTQQDTGAYMYMGMNLLLDGVPPEASHPYPSADQTTDRWYRKYYLQASPSAEANEAATLNRGGQLRPVYKISELKASLDEGHPVVFGFLVFANIFAAEKGGMLSVPNIGSDELLGGHAVMAVGYDDESQLLTLKNSWSDKWGDKGYFYMPYRYFDTELGLSADAWTMR